MANKSESKSKIVLSKPSNTRRAWRTLWLLTKRDLKVRYSTSLLGYLWSVLDPLILSFIYWFIFTQMMPRSLGEAPYIVFLLSAMLPWIWFNSAVNDSTRAFLKDVRLVRSVSLPRWVWVARIVLGKGIEFLLSLPVLIAFIIATKTEINPLIALYPLGLILMTSLIFGIGMILAPLVVFFRDVERATKLILRITFYATPIIYSSNNLPPLAENILLLNPLAGIISIFRAGFFENQLNWMLVAYSSIVVVIVFTTGLIVFKRFIGRTLKEL